MGHNLSHRRQAQYSARRPSIVVVVVVFVRYKNLRLEVLQCILSVSSCGS